jgi:hypothetical protein
MTPQDIAVAERHPKHVRDDADNMAFEIGNNLADAAAGPVGSFAFGQMMSAMGFQQQDPVAAALAQISAQLAALQKSVDALTAEMNNEITQLNYDLVIAPVTALIADNQTLLGNFQTLAQDTTDADRDATKATINVTLPNMVNAPAVWNDTLCGTAGQTGVIEAWSRVVHTHCADFFGPTQSASIQQHWNFLDGQQALSVLYAVEHANSVGDSSTAANIISVWQTNRTAQLALLRGMPIGDDTFNWRDPVTNAITAVTTPVKALPPLVICKTIAGQASMVYISISGPVSLASIDATIPTEAMYAAHYTGVGLSSAAAPLIPTDTWNVLQTQDLIEFLNACGGSVGQGADDYFIGALNAHGFMTTEPYRLWTDVPREGGYPVPTPFGMEGFRNVFVEGSGWWNPSTNPDDTAGLLLARQLDAGEADNYWYENA